MANVFEDGCELVWPGWPLNNLVSNIANDASGEKQAHIARIWRAGDLSKVHFPIGDADQAPANGIKISFQGITADAPRVKPDDTPTHYAVIPQGSILADTVMVSPVITDDGTSGGNKKTVAVGDILVVVWEFDSFSAGDDWDGSFIANAGYAIPPTLNAGSMVYDVGAGWTTANLYSPTSILEYADGTLVPMVKGMAGLGSVSWTEFTGVTDVSSPDEIGAKFVAPYTGKIGGVVFRQSTLSANTSIWTLYDSDDTELATRTRPYPSVSIWANTVCKVWFDTPATVSKGDTYRISLKRGDGGTAYLYRYDYSAAIAAVMQGGADFVWTQREDAGSWTDTSTRKPSMGIFYTELASGGIPQGVHPIEAGITT